MILLSNFVLSPNDGSFKVGINQAILENGLILTIEKNICILYKNIIIIQNCPSVLIL